MNALMTIEAMKGPALALDIPKNQTFDEWREMGRNLAEGQRVINWWIGDWWAFGSHKWGERAKAAAEGFFPGKSFGTLSNIGSVCRAFEPSRRREVLDFSDHVPVASLPAEDADEILDRAVEKGWGQKEIRVEAMKRKVALGLFKPPERSDPDPAYDELMVGVRWWNRATAETRSEFLDLASGSHLGVIEA